MASKNDVLQAKETLSGRLLRARVRADVVRTRASIRVAEAVASAASNIHAVGIGRKIVDGKETKQLCVRIYVVQKLAESLLSAKSAVPAELDGIPTDVIESPPAFIQPASPACTLNRKKRQRPVVAGISTAHFQVTAGTLAYFFRSTKTGDDANAVYALSNNHVYADVNQAHLGDALYQPGPADGGTAADHFADLSRFVKIKLGGTQINRVDCAIGKLLEGITYRARLCTIGKITGTAVASEGMLVRKHGRTTGYTEGKVTDDSYDALVGMDHNNPAIVALFKEQMRIERIAPYPAIGLGGDSGSLVVMKSQRKAVGLYFAGPSSGVYGIANHLENVLTELQIQLV
ncbi:MAG: hypothetical protein HY231_24780 [Acidobacteria bacterium]|nr:hypothetical protein [Acidobacteriota bacterium]